MSAHNKPIWLLGALALVGILTFTACGGEGKEAPAAKTTSQAEVAQQVEEVARQVEEIAQQVGEVSQQVEGVAQQVDLTEHVEDLHSMDPSYRQQVGEDPFRFTFGAGADHGFNQTDDSGARAEFIGNELTSFLNVVDASDIEFYLAAGDLSYDGHDSESAWCQYVKDHLPTKQAQYDDQFPFQLVTGNHEDNGKDGLIRNYAACMPDRLGVTGDYGVQYYFDYPAASPMARFIAISPDMTVDERDYQYNTGGAGSDQQWLIDAIRDANEDSWIIVFEHRTCISLGEKDCQIGEVTMDLLIDEGVDLVIQGHEHNYERSHSLSCADVDVFLPECVADDGSDAVYARDTGTVFLIAGTVGRLRSDLNTSDPEANYFAAWMDGVISEPAGGAGTYGYVEYTVTNTSLTAQFVPTSGGNFADRFEIISFNEGCLGGGKGTC